MSNEVTFTPAKVRALRKAYQAAIDDGRDQFTFEGREVLVSYARYLLEYLEARLPWN